MITFKIVRRGLAPPTMSPSLLRLTPASFGVERSVPIRRGRLRAPPGWSVESPAPLAWFVKPDIGQIHIDELTELRLEVEFEDGCVRQYGRAVNVRLDLQTTFAIDHHAFWERNSAAAIGEIGPTRQAFAKTYRLLSRPLADVLFRGLYSDVVQLRLKGAHRGGLCSGMARWAGLRAIRGDVSQPSLEDAVNEICTLHGRQLTDRALMASFGWFLRASPVAAYRTVRDEALQTGMSLRALDVAVPKPLRPDIATAVVREGHTIVPFRIRQESPSRAFIDCYDPNRGRETHTLEIHLDTGRYAYRNKVSLDDDEVGLIAVEHDVYAREGTAFLAVLGSLIWNAIGPGPESRGE